MSQEMILRICTMTAKLLRDCVVSRCGSGLQRQQALEDDSGLPTSGTKAIPLSSLRNRSSRDRVSSVLPELIHLRSPTASCLGASTWAVAETCICCRLTLPDDAVRLGTEAVEVDRGQCIINETLRIALVE